MDDFELALMVLSIDEFKLVPLCVELQTRERLLTYVIVVTLLCGLIRTTQLTRSPHFPSFLSFAYSRFWS